MLGRFRAVPLLLLGLGLVQHGVAWADDPVTLRDDRVEYPLGLHLEILEDPKATWTIDDVSSPPLSERFERSRREIPNLGLTRSAFWVRFRLDDRTSASRDWLLNVDWPRTGLIQFYSPRAAGGWSVERAGELLPHDEWALPYRKPTFHVALEPGESRTYYARFEGETTMLFPLTLWSAPAFEAE